MILTNGALLDRFLQSDPGTLTATSPDSVFLWVRALTLPTTFDPQSGAASLLSGTAVLSSDGIAVRALLSEWLTRLADAEEEKQGLRMRNREVQGRLASYAARAGRGQTNLGSMVTTLGPSVLGELRADSALVEAVVLKAAVQEVYLGNLQELGDILDSLAQALHGG